VCIFYNLTLCIDNTADIDDTVNSIVEAQPTSLGLKKEKTRWQIVKINNICILKVILYKSGVA